MNDQFIENDGNVYQHSPENSTSHDKEYHLVETTLHEREILEHSLGIQMRGGKKTRGGYRNYFMAGYHTDMHRSCLRLVEKGLMRTQCGSAEYFAVTELGMKQIGFVPKDGDSVGVKE